MPKPKTPLPGMASCNPYTNSPPQSTKRAYNLPFCGVCGSDGVLWSNERIAEKWKVLELPKRTCHVSWMNYSTSTWLSLKIRVILKGNGFLLKKSSFCGLDPRSRDITKKRSRRWGFSLRLSGRGTLPGEFEKRPRRQLLQKLIT